MDGTRPQIIPPVSAVCKSADSVSCKRVLVSQHCVPCHQGSSPASYSPLQAACEYFRATRSAHSLGVQAWKLQDIVVRPHILHLSPSWTHQVTLLEDSQLAQTGSQGSMGPLLLGHSGLNTYTRKLE